MVKLTPITASLLLLLLTNDALAINWIIDHNKSQLGFVATQNGAPVKGYFKKFDANIQFNENDLEHSRIQVTIDTNSISTSYDELTSTLLSSEWFNTKQFPKAVFTATLFKKVGEHRYVAHGTLSIKSTSQPIDLNFQATLPTPTTAIVHGETVLQRNIFHIGEGEWASTDEIKDNVSVSFELHASQQ